MRKSLYTFAVSIYTIFALCGIQSSVFAKSDYITLDRGDTNYIYNQVKDIISDYHKNDATLTVLSFFGINIAYAQTAEQISYIKQRITQVIDRVDGKITLEVKNSLLTILTNKIKTVSDPILLDIWVHFLREVKDLRVIWEIININTPTTTTTTSTPPPASTTYSNVDFIVDFASFTITPTLWQKFGTVRVKIKNIWDTYVPTSSTMLKFGCKGIDWNYYAYRTYNNYENIANQGEIIFEIPNITISNLTASSWYKILNCKVNPDNITPESNFENNTVSIPFVIQ